VIVIPPVTLTLESSTATASALDEWSSSTSYTTGQQVKVTSAVPHKEYEALQSSTNKAPATETTYWRYLRVTNPYRLIDDKSSSRTYGTSDFTAVLSCPSRISHVGAVSIDNATAVNITLADDVGEIASTTISLARNAGLAQHASWSEYYFDQILYATSFIWEPPAYVTACDITLEFIGPTDEQVGVGHVFAGRAYNIGGASYGLTTGIQDASRKDADEFGDVVLVQRAYRDKLSAQLIINPYALDSLKRVLSDLRATPCFWDANVDNGYGCSADDLNYDSLRVWGFYTDFSIQYAEPNAVYTTLEIEGLT